MGALIAGIALVAIAAAVLYEALTGAGDDANNNFGTNPVGGTTTPCSTRPPIVHAAVFIKEITFAANHIVEKDTYGYFPRPEWSDTRSAADQSPVCYTRNRPVQLTPTFHVTRQPTQTDQVELRAVAVWRDVIMNFHGSVSVSPGDQTVTAAQMTSDVSLPNYVDCVDPFELGWGMNPAGMGWNSAGTSDNLLYVVLADPANGRPAYWTLLDVSCRAASLQTTDTGVIAAVYAPLRALWQIKRKRDGATLTYWGTNPYSLTGAMSTYMLLNAANASGQCGSWANFLLDMYQVHGITRGRKIALARSAAFWQGNGTVGFLVKHWQFNTPPPSSPNDWTHVLYTECVITQKAPGQNNASPPEYFTNHYIVWIDGQYWDPSYGAGPFPAQGDWENASIDGLVNIVVNPRLAGFDKSLPPNPATNLLDFVSIPE
jgi:hypothetical protein